VPRIVAQFVGTFETVRRALLLSSFAALLSLLALGLALAVPSAALAKSYAEEDKSLAYDYTAIEGAKLGVVLPGGPESFLHIEQSSHYVLPSPTGPALGETYCYDAAGGAVGPAVGCKIVISVAAHKENEIRETVSHEVFHAFQEVMAGTLANFNAKPYKTWLIEGSAAWVESDLVANNRGARIDWTSYLRSPGKELFTRSYDAIGFFGHMAQSGISPWSRFRAMFAATSSSAAYAAGVGTNLDFLGSEASVFFREGAFGEAWSVLGPNVPSRSAVAFKPTPEKITAGSRPLTLRARPYADGTWELKISGLPKDEPVVEVAVDAGHLRVHSAQGAGDANTANESQVLLCTSSKGCSCPTHTSHYVNFTSGYFALTSGTSEGKIELTRRKPCEELLAPKPCETILPGFSKEVQQGVEQAVPGSLNASVTTDGSNASTCALLVKNASLSGPEETFRGVVAPIVSVLRASTAAGAAKYYGIVTKASIPEYTVTHPEVGAEATLETHEAAALGGTEYESFAVVRESNVVVEFSLFSAGGNNEADAAGSLALLRAVTQSL
jgi:hypothetical protein